MDITETKTKKPLSEKQLAANRRNAQKSQGPVTPQGKINSGHASQKHVILTDTVLIDSESRPRFAKLTNSLFAEFLPQTQAERIYVEKMAVAHWNTTRLWSLQSTAINLAIHNRRKSHPGEDVLSATAQAIQELSQTGRPLDVYTLQMQRFDTLYNHAIQGLQRHRNKNLPGPETSPENDTPEASHQPNENKEPTTPDHPIWSPVDPILTAVDPIFEPVDPI